MGETAANERFDRIDAVLERICDRLDRIEQRLDRVEQRLDRVEQRLDQVEQRLDRMEHRLGQLELGQANLTKYVLDMREEVSTRLQSVESRLEILTVNSNGIDSRMAAVVKGVLDTGTVLSQTQREQWKLKDAEFDLSARVAKLEENFAKFIHPAA